MAQMSAQLVLPKADVRARAQETSDASAQPSDPTGQGGRGLRLGMDNMPKGNVGSSTSSACVPRKRKRKAAKSTIERDINPSHNDRRASRSPSPSDSHAPDSSSRPRTRRPRKVSISSGSGSSSGESKHGELDRGDTADAGSGTDSGESYHLAMLELAKAQLMVIKMEYVDQPRLELERDKLYYEMDNADVIHQRQMETKRADFLLERAKTHSASEAIKLKQAEIEVLRLRLLLQGINPGTGASGPARGAT